MVGVCVCVCVCVCVTNCTARPLDRDDVSILFFGTDFDSSKARKICVNASVKRSDMSRPCGRALQISLAARTTAAYCATMADTYAGVHEKGVSPQAVSLVLPLRSSHFDRSTEAESQRTLKREHS